MGEGGATRFRDVRRYAEVDSTNRVVADLARDGTPEGVVIVADHQTAGRGRWGRRWEAPPGSSLLVSVLLRPIIDPPAVPLVTLGAGVAAAEAAAAVTGVPVELKWPNDVMAGDGKLGGILTELVPGGPVAAVVVGLGLNVNWEGPMPDGATALNQLTGHGVDPGALLEAFLCGLGAVADQLETPGGPRAVLDRYCELSSTLGRMVTITGPGGELVGRARAVGVDGRLVVETPDGARRAIAAGEVTHLRDRPPDLVR